MKEYTVYMHVSPSGKRYVGITCMNVNQRWRGDGSGYKGQAFYNAIIKYGWNNIKHIIIARGLTEDEAKWLEIELIREWDTTNKHKGYNITMGGDGTVGYHHTEEWKINNCGENHPMFGKHHTEETKKKISEATSGKNNPFYGKGYLISGEKHYFYGAVMSEEQRKKISESRIKNAIAKGKNNPNAKAVICITTMKIFDTSKEGAEFYKTNRSGISQCCHGTRKSSGRLEDGTPLVWKLLKDYLVEQKN